MRSRTERRLVRNVSRLGFQGSGPPAPLKVTGVTRIRERSRASASESRRSEAFRVTLLQQRQNISCVPLDGALNPRKRRGRCARSGTPYSARRRPGFAKTPRPERALRYPPFRSRALEPAKTSRATSCAPPNEHSRSPSWLSLPAGVRRTATPLVTCRRTARRRWSRRRRPTTRPSSARARGGSNAV